MCREKVSDEQGGTESPGSKVGELLMNSVVLIKSGNNAWISFQLISDLKYCTCFI